MVFFFFCRYNVADFYPPPPTSGMELRQPIWAPARVLINLTVWAFIFLVPILYWRIFKFRNTQVATAGVHVFQMYLSYKIEDFNDKLGCPVNSWKIILKGINEAERKRRKRANVLTTKINFIAWMIEVITIFSYILG